MEENDQLAYHESKREKENNQDKKLRPNQTIWDLLGYGIKLAILTEDGLHVIKLTS